MAWRFRHHDLAMESISVHQFVPSKWCFSLQMLDSWIARGGSLTQIPVGLVKSAFLMLKNRCRLLFEVPVSDAETQSPIVRPAFLMVRVSPKNILKKGSIYHYFRRGYDFTAPCWGFLICIYVYIYISVSYQLCIYIYVYIIWQFAT